MKSFIFSHDRTLKSRKTALKGKLSPKEISIIDNGYHLKIHEYINFHPFNLFYVEFNAGVCYLVIKSLSNKFQRASFGAIELLSLICPNSLT